MISGRLEIVRGEDALDISDVVNYVVEATDGFGMPALHRIGERGPLQHGVSDRGYRLDPRTIQIGVTMRAADWASYYARRSELLSYLAPDQALKLRFTQPDGTVRQIDGYCTDGPSFASKDRLLYRFHKAVFQIYCPDPAWYDPVRRFVRVTGGSGGEGFAFPMPVAWTFGGETVDQSVAMPYSGTWNEYPEIVINGPVSDARIEHIESGDVLDFDGTVIDNGDHYTIDLRYAYKTIVDAAGANKIATLTAGSDLATWRLRPGVNTVRFSGVLTGENTSIILRWNDRYLGV